MLRNDGIWMHNFLPGNYNNLKDIVLFLDRDGIINKDTGYPHKPEHIQLLPDIARLISFAKSTQQWHVAVVTNQSGIGHGYYNWDSFAKVQDHIYEQLESLNGLRFGGIDLVMACPFHEKGLSDYKVADHFYRKPNPGMLLEAGEILRAKMNRSWIVGDKLSDMKAGYRAGVAGGFLVAAPPEIKQQINKLRLFDNFTLYCVETLNEIIDIFNANPDVES